MQVAKHLQRDPSHCLLGDAGEHQLAQLGEQRGRETERAVGQQQCRRHDDHRLRLGDVQRVDQFLEDDRYGDVRAFGGEQAGQGDHHPILVGPQVGEQLAKRLPVVAFGGLGAGQCGGGSASHGRILSIRRRPAVNPLSKRRGAPRRPRSRHRRGSQWRDSSASRAARPMKTSPVMRSSQRPTPGRRDSSAPTRAANRAKRPKITMVCSTKTVPSTII